MKEFLFFKQGAHWKYVSTVTCRTNVSDLILFHPKSCLDLQMLQETMINDSIQNVYNMLSQISNFYIQSMNAIIRFVF